MFICKNNLLLFLFLFNVNEILVIYIMYLIFGSILNVVFIFKVKVILKLVYNVYLFFLSSKIGYYLIFDFLMFYKVVVEW